jgi:hypothetical protein
MKVLKFFKKKSFLCFVNMVKPVVKNLAIFYFFSNSRKLGFCRRLLSNGWTYSLQFWTHLQVPISSYGYHKMSLTAAAPNDNGTLLCTILDHGTRCKQNPKQNSLEQETRSRWRSNNICVMALGVLCSQTIFHTSTNSSVNFTIIIFNWVLLWLFNSTNNKFFF